ncbi:S-adenosyl-L-methionine-dependent methyltransferase [Lentinula guzmanii]|uniref:S-adenosyl-L-methionine-dependent methyltransferase n=1 Tax=Lentinula guzmanii TaxID=2804957 RepID=A0AA38JMI9_9AGAR|nr:S-adenosyl-L-methionine-dependent methyltransferase [Lentinula guzmanii]
MLEVVSDNSSNREAKKTGDPSFHSAYILPANEPERERLDQQSRFMTKAVFGGKLISTQTNISPGDEILESATGTGIWLLDLARELPTPVSLTGIDISSRLFPTNYPSNVTFSSQSVTSLPESWSNKFNLINQRLLTGALTKEQWPNALSELYRVLKPGAWIQLMETGPTPKMYSGPKMRRMVDSWASLYRLRGLVTDIQDILEQLLSEAGFVEVKKQTVPLPLSPGREDYEEHKNNIVGFFLAAKQPFLMTGQFESETEFDEALKEMQDEWDSSSRCWWEWAVFHAKKKEKTEGM